jgi:hypothetical protein
MLVDSNYPYGLRPRIPGFYAAYIRVWIKPQLQLNYGTESNSDSYGANDNSTETKRLDCSRAREFLSIYAVIPVRTYLGLE